MINFIVLKESLNFGFLSYRNTIEEKAYYTIFNQPICKDLDERASPIPLNGFISINFTDAIEESYGDIFIKILDNKNGIQYTEDTNDNLIYKFESINYITGDFNFRFQMCNNYFESDICTLSIKVSECYKHCKTCSSQGTSFIDQRCDT